MAKSLYCAAGGHSALTAEPGCQVIRFDSFLSDLPDALNNCYSTVWHFALWALNSGHSVFSTGVIYVFITQKGVHGASKHEKGKEREKKVNDEFVLTLNLQPLL